MAEKAFYGEPDAPEERVTPGWRCRECNCLMDLVNTVHEVYQCPRCGLAWRITQAHPVEGESDSPKSQGCKIKVDSIRRC